MSPSIFPTSNSDILNRLTVNMNVEVLCSLVSVNGHIMERQIGLVYVPPHLLDENMLHSLTSTAWPLVLLSSFDSARFLAAMSRV